LSANFLRILVPVPRPPQIPFRETHHISGSCIRLSEEHGVPLSQLSLEQFQSVCPTFEADVVDVFNFETSVERRDAVGGTSRRAVVEQIESLKKVLVETSSA
jgi:argininosuccinate lyase